jgi:hypothetical protein
MKRLCSALIIFALVCPAYAEQARHGQAVKVNIAWRQKDFPGTATLYEVKGNPGLWETKSVANLAAAPVGQPIAGSSFELKPGHKKRFALVVQNDTGKPMYFFAAPHTVQPEEQALGFKFKCLCVNRSYTIGPKETWYRIVEFRLFEDFAGTELTVTHTLIGIDQKRAASASSDATMPEM